MSAKLAMMKHKHKPKSVKVDVFNHLLSISKDSDPKIASKLLAIADKYPVHRTLQYKATVMSELVFK